MRALTTILTNSSPSGVASALGFRIQTSSQGHPVIEHPRFGTFYLTDFGYIATERSTALQFRAGSAVDLAAWCCLLEHGAHPGPDAYRKGIARIMAGYGNRFGDSTCHDDAFIDEAVQQAVARRALFDFTHGRRKKDKVSASYLDMLNTCTSFGVQNPREQNRILILERVETERFRQLLKQVNPAASKALEVRDCFVVPYLSNHHTVAAFDVFSSQNKRTSRKISVEEATHCWSGLDRCIPGQEVFIYADPMTALNAQIDRDRLKQTGACVSVECGSADAAAGWTPSRALYSGTTDLTTIKLWAALARDGCNLSIEDHPGEDWKQASVNCLIQHIRESNGQLTPKAEAMLDILSEMKEVRRAVVEELRIAGLRYAVEQIYRKYPEGLIWTGERYDVYTSERGYRVNRRGNATPEMISNFTIEISSNLIYPEREEFLHYGQLHIGGKSAPLVLHTEDMDSTSRFDKAVKQAAIAAPELRDAGTPAVLMPVEMKMLLRELKKRASALPVQEGVSTLGWNYGSRMFAGPGFCVTSDGVRSIEMIAHPSAPALKYYRQVDGDDGRLADNLPAGLADIISICAAYTARSYMGYSIRPVMMKNTPDTVQALHRLFSALGQEGPVHLNINRRTPEMPGINGFPFYGTGYSDKQVQTSRMPCFLLGDSGMTLRGTPSDEMFEAAGRCLMWALSSVAAFMLRTKGVEFETMRSVVFQDAMLKEGRELIRRMANLREWPYTDSSYCQIDDYLRQIPFEDGEAFFEHDFATQRIYLTITHTTTDPVDLLNELTIYCGGAVLLDDGRIELPAVRGAEMLTDYYGNMPATRVSGLAHASLLPVAKEA